MRLILLSALLLLCAVQAAHAQASRNWRPEDRLVVGDWTRIRAVAAGPDRVFIVSPDGVLAFSPLLRRWEGPFLPPVPGALERVTAGMIDPLDNSLWLSAFDGWVHFQPDVQVWERGEAGGRLLDFAFDLAAPFEGLHFRTSTGWFKVPRGALVPVPASAPIRPSRPATVAEALASNPALGGAASAFLLDPSLQNARLTSAARSFDNLGWYLGTDGVGALFVADGMVVPQRLHFGLPGPVVGAIYAVPGGIWVLTDRVETGQSALTFVASDLTEFRVFSGPAATGLPYTSARRLIGVGNGLWAATDAGVLRFDTGDPSQYRLYDERAGLPDRRVASIASRRGNHRGSHGARTGPVRRHDRRRAARARLRRLGRGGGRRDRHHVDRHLDGTARRGAWRAGAHSPGGRRGVRRLRKGGLRLRVAGRHARGDHERSVALAGPRRGSVGHGCADLERRRPASPAGRRRRRPLGGGGPWRGVDAAGRSAESGR